jgi:Tol biopolymer transport system component
LAAGFPGRIVFDSDRSGTFGIYSMAADGSDVQTVSDTPMQEICPDPSPDGKWIVFARAMSLSKSAPSEIRVCAAGGGDERQLANDGTFPTFSADGRVVFFERGRKKIMAVNFDGTGERELFPAQSREFDRYQIIKPRISPDGRYAAFISDRKGAWNTWYADLFSGEAVHVHSGCEAAWFSDSRKLAWVCERDAKERTGIFRYDLDARRIDALQDADAPRGHEYFPTVTPDDGYLLWSACREGEHEHTDSNYQIFVRALPDGEPVRVTFDGFDDRWPKVLRPDADSGRPSN